MPTRRSACAAVLMCLALVGCASSPSMAPDWITSTPQSKAAIYAVGSCPPTRFEQDALEGAKTQARTELARALQVSVSGVLVDWQASSGGSTGAHGHSEEFIATMSRETLDVSMSGSQIISFWCDREGVVSYKGTWWALAKLDKSSLAEELVKSAKATVAKMAKQKKDVSAEEQASIEERARNAFADLDKQFKNIE